MVVFDCVSRWAITRRILEAGISVKVPCGSHEQRASITQKWVLTWGHSHKVSKVQNLSKQEKHEGVVRDAHWCSWFPWHRQWWDVGSAAEGWGGSSCWLKWARGSWGCRGSCGRGSFGDRRYLQEIECISVQNKRTQVRFLLPQRRTRLTSSWMSWQKKWNYSKCTSTQAVGTSTAAFSHFFHARI